MLKKFKGRTVLPALLVLFISSSLLLIVALRRNRTPEPRYSGLAFFQVMRKCSFGDRGVVPLIEQMGPEAMPYWQEIMRDSRKKELYGRLWKKLPRKAKAKLPPYPIYGSRDPMVLFAIKTYIARNGDATLPLTNELVRVIHGTNVFHQKLAMDAIGLFGPSAISLESEITRIHFSDNRYAQQDAQRKALNSLRSTNYWKELVQVELSAPNYPFQ